MSEQDRKPSGWIGRRMLDLKDQSKNWPAWKQEDLRERLSRDEVQRTRPETTSESE